MKIYFSNTSSATNAASTLNDMMSCPHHRDILLPLSCIIQVCNDETKNVYCFTVFVQLLLLFFRLFY